MIKEAIDEFYEKYGSEQTIKYLESLILEMKNGEVSYYFAKKMDGTSIKAHEQIVIETNDANLNCSFAYDVRHSDLEKLADALLEIGDEDTLIKLDRHLRNVEGDSEIQSSKRRVARTCHEKLITSQIYLKMLEDDVDNIKRLIREN